MKSIYIGGKERPFKFGFNAIDIFCRDYGLSLDGFIQKFTEISKGKVQPGMIRDIIYAGLASATLMHNEAPGFTKYDVGDWLDELGSEGLSKIMKTLAESFGGDKKKFRRRNTVPTQSYLFQSYKAKRPCRINTRRVLANGYA